MTERSGSLHATALSRAYAGVRALEGVTVTVRRHEVIGLIGPNGAGKSTLVNLLSGFDFPTSGSVMLEGVDITTWSAHRRVRSGLVRTFQHGHAFPGLTARENVEVAALGTGAARGVAARRATELLDLLGLADRANAEAATLPHGDERLLGVARALATMPKFVLLDEPAAGLNEDEINAFADIITLVRDERNAGILLIDHHFCTC